MSKQVASPGPIQLSLARRPFRITTPEGVSLRFSLAEIGDRMGAFLLDSVLSFGIVFLLWQAFVILYMPMLYKKEVLYVTYTIVCFYVYFVSFGKSSDSHSTTPLVSE